MSKPRMVIIVEGGVVQSVLVDAPGFNMEVHLLDYDNLKEGRQVVPTVELDPELNSEIVEQLISGEHEDVAPLVKANRLAEQEFAFEG